MSDGAIVLNETIHQSTRLRIMTLLVSQAETDRVAYGFIQRTLDLTAGNLTIHLRKLDGAGYVAIAKEFQGSKPRTWVRGDAGGASRVRRVRGESGAGAEPPARSVGGVRRAPNGRRALRACDPDDEEPRFDEQEPAHQRRNP